MDARGTANYDFNSVKMQLFVVTEQLMSTKLHMNLSNHYGLIGKCQYVECTVRSLIPGHNPLMAAPSDQFLRVSKTRHYSGEQR